MILFMSLFYHFGTFYASTYLGHYHVRMILSLLNGLNPLLFGKPLI